MNLSGYSKIYNFGHKLLQDYFDEEVIVEEKVDGSQFSFAKIDGQLFCRSRGKQLDLNNPEKMFIQGIEAAKKLLPLLKEGYVYRGEYLSGPKHNTLRYDRIPENHIILFDITTNVETYMNREEKEAEAKRIGLECVPLFFKGRVTSADQLRRFLETLSVLSDNQKVEGVVCKRYDKFGPDAKVLMAKFVSEEFKEKHNKDWKDRNKTSKTIIESITHTYKTTARWDKAIQHLKEAGKIEDDVKDIGLLMKEVNKDILEECKDEIKDILFKWAWKDLSRQLVKGLPEYYKQKLLDKQFDRVGTTVCVHGTPTNEKCILCEEE